MTQQEIPLHGGNISTVVRVGDTVRRNAGPWTPAVHALLRHLEYVGFTGAPRALGIDERGREVLSYLDGECGEYPLAPHWVTEEALVTVATMLRMFHDAQYGFQPPPGGVALVRAAAAGHRGDLPPRRRAAQRDLAAGRHAGADRLRPGLAGRADLRRGVRGLDLGTAVLRPGLVHAGLAPPQPAPPVAPLRRRLRAGHARPAPAGPDDPQADRRPRRGNPPDGGGRRSGLRPNRAQGPSTPSGPRSPTDRL